MPCTDKECTYFGQARASSCKCYKVTAPPAEFKKQNFGATVATIREYEDGALEVQDMGDGTYSLTVHSRIGETDRFDDMSIKLERKHFAALGSIADR